MTSNVLTRREVLSLTLSLPLAPLMFPNRLDGQLVQGPEWHKPFPAFRIAGNLYYVGTMQLGAYVLHSLQGDVLINANMQQDLPLLKQSIQQAGLKYSDITYILLNNAHGEHDGAAGTVKRETGAVFWVMGDDASVVERSTADRAAARVDRVLRDGYSVEAGGAKLIARHTPGRTKGGTTWTLRVLENDKVFNVVIAGHPVVDPGTMLVNNSDYPNIATDFVKTFALLKTLPCDIFLSAHASNFGLKEKYAKLKAGNSMAFVDSEGYQAWVAAREQAFLAEWERQKKHPPARAK